MEDSLEIEIRDIYRLYYKDVYQLLLCFTNRNDAEDLTQDVFMRVLKALPKFEGRSQIKTWILSIARNTAIDFYRRRKLLSFVEEKILNNISSKNKSIEQLVVEDENKQSIYVALQRLKPNYRVVIYLRAIKEYSVKETAEILGVKESKVKVDYHRGIKKLMDILEVENENNLTINF